MVIPVVVVIFIADRVASVVKPLPLPLAVLGADARKEGLHHGICHGFGTGRVLARDELAVADAVRCEVRAFFV